MYLVSPERFVSAWQMATSVDEVSQATGLSRAACCSRAGSYRARGIELKCFPRGRSRLDVRSLGILADSLNLSKTSPRDRPEELGNLVRA